MLFYTTSNGTKVVQDAIDRLPVEQRAAIHNLIKLHRDNKLLPRNLKYLHDDLYELRTTAKGQELRLLFGRVNPGKPDEAPVCVAVHVLVKKSQKTPKRDLDKARKRLKDWVQRNYRAVE